jgi:hypothetical protein
MNEWWARLIRGVLRCSRQSSPTADRPYPGASGGRTWWARFEFTRINIEPIILQKKIEDVREAGAPTPVPPDRSVDDSGESINRIVLSTASVPDLKFVNRLFVPLVHRVQGGTDGQTRTPTRSPGD